MNKERKLKILEFLLEQELRRGGDDSDDWEINEINNLIESGNKNE